MVVLLLLVLFRNPNACSDSYSCCYSSQVVFALLALYELGGCLGLRIDNLVLESRLGGVVELRTWAATSGSRLGFYSHASRF